MAEQGTEYDRSRILEAASKARARRRYRRAASLLRRILVVEPSNLELHARLAPLLATSGQGFDAWASYQICAQAALREKRLDRASNVYREAVRYLPRELEAWRKLANIERQRGHAQQAVEILLEGRQNFRARRRRPQAIGLLRRAHEIAPWTPEIVLDLARTLGRSDQECEAQLLLEKLAQRVSGRRLRRVRSAQWRIAPTLINTWRLAATLGALRDADDEPARTRSFQT